MFIIKTSESYDIERIALDVSHVMFAMKGANHINLTMRTDDDCQYALSFRADSLYDRKAGKYIHSESEWNTFNPLFLTTHLYEVYQDVCRYAKEHYNLNIGRVRINTLPAKQCLTLHRDMQEEIRFHIPVATNPGAMFINDDQVGRMEEEGRLYIYKTSMLHTAINASREPRTHLVFSTYKE